MPACETVVVHCMDFRLQAHLERWLAEGGPAGGYDRIALAGGVHELRTVLRHVGIAVRLHGVRRAVLVNHEDCGAYGPAGTLARHRHDLRRASAQIRRRHPGLECETYFLRLDGDMLAIP